MNILLAGEESAGIHALQTLQASGHTVVGVMASPNPKYGGPVQLWTKAHKLGYRTWPSESLKDPRLAQQIRLDKVDLLLNVHSLHVIHDEVLQAPRLGCFNLHPGPLPRYAGLNPVCWALYFGEENHGVTLHRMTRQIDAGPIVYQCIFPVTPTDTGLSVSLRCIQKGLPMIAQLLQTLSGAPSDLPEVPQDLSKRKYFGREVPNNGRLNWCLPAEQLLNFVRACDFEPFRSPWGHPQSRKGTLEIQIVKARRSGVRADVRPGTVGYVGAAGLAVACLDEWISLDKIRVQERLLDAAEVLRISDHLESDVN